MGFLFRIALLTLFSLAVFAAAGVQAQDKNTGGLLAVPDRGGGVLSVPESSFLSVPPEQPDAAPTTGPAGALLNINPMRLEESPVMPPASAAPSAQDAQKEKPADAFGNLKIEGSAGEKDEMWWMNDILAKLSPGIQDDLLDRAGKAQLYCEENYMLNNFYDCECYAIAVLKDLVLKGGESETIALNVADERFRGCVDTGKIAGMAYNRCQESLLLMQITDRMLEDTCTCTARAMARSYKKNPVADIDRADRAFNNLLLDCRQNAMLGNATGGSP